MQPFSSVKHGIYALIQSTLYFMSVHIEVILAELMTSVLYKIPLTLLQALKSYPFFLKYISNHIYDLCARKSPYVLNPVVPSNTLHHSMSFSSFPAGTHLYHTHTLQGGRALYFIETICYRGEGFVLYGNNMLQGEGFVLYRNNMLQGGGFCTL